MSKHHRSCARPAVLAIIGIMVIWSLAIVTASAIELSFVGSVVATSPGRSARGVAITPDGKTLYVGGIQDRSLVRVDIDAAAVTADVSLANTINPGAYGKAVCLDAQGRVWAPLTIPMIAVFSADLKLEAAFDLAPFGIVNPEGAIVSANGDIYVTDRKGKPGIYRFQQQGSELVLDKAWGNNGHVSLVDLRDPALLPNGDMLLNLNDKGELDIMDLASGKLSVLTTTVPKPYYIDVDAAGRIYVVHYDRKDAALSILNPDGSLVRSWSPAELGIKTEVAGVAASRDGKRVYVLDQRTAAGGLVLMFEVR